MPTLAELQQETWWSAEFQPPTLALLTAQLRHFYQVPNINIGSKGDEYHLRGYHRSRNWILNSRYATNRTYSVTETAGNRSGGNPDWLCALDITLPLRHLIPMTQRLDEAVRGGDLEKVTEWYGNMDGDERVDGYNNILNRLASSSSSHLWHDHLSLDRGRAGENHSDLYRILTGVDQVPTIEEILAADVVRQTGITYRLDDTVWEARQHAMAVNNGRFPELFSRVTRLEEKLDQVLSLLHSGVPVPGQAELSDESIKAVADAVATEIRADPERDGHDS